jgi:hypothetical protein
MAEKEPVMPALFLFANTIPALQDGHMVSPVANDGIPDGKHRNRLLICHT